MSLDQVIFESQGPAMFLYFTDYINACQDVLTPLTQFHFVRSFSVTYEVAI